MLIMIPYDGDVGSDDDSGGGEKRSQRWSRRTREEGRGVSKATLRSLSPGLNSCTAALAGWAAALDSPSYARLKRV